MRVDFPGTAPANAPARAPVHAPDQIDAITAAWPATRHLAAYWQALSRARPHGPPVPPRHAIDQVALSPILGQSGLLDRDRDGTVRFRLVGAALRRRMHLPLPGLPLRTIFHPVARAGLDALFAEVFDAPAQLRITVADGGAAGQVAILPLSDRNGAISRAVFVISLGDAPDNGPARLRPIRVHLARVAAPPAPVPRRRFRVIDGGRA